MGYVIEHRGEPIARAETLEVADAFAAACAGGGETVRVVEEGARRGRVYRGDRAPIEESAAEESAPSAPVIFPNP